VLVVDDNEHAADILRDLLRLQGYDVRTAYDGLNAVTQVQAFQPAVTIIDLLMPRLDGFAAAEALHALPTGDAPLLIALTGWNQEEDRRRARRSRLDHYYVKPLDVAVLHRLLASSRPN